MAARGGRRYPAIIFNRGGNEDFGRLEAGDLRFLRGFARRGFVVLASQYRGADGAPGLDEFGGAGAEDVRSLFPLARELGGIDLDDVFMFGFSRGGMMTYLAIRDGAPGRARRVPGGAPLALRASRCVTNASSRGFGRILPARPPRTDRSRAFDSPRRGCGGAEEFHDQRRAPAAGQNVPARRDSPIEVRRSS